MSLAKRAVKGMAWAYAVFFGGRLVSLVTTAILARLLVPADFGVIGFALLMLSFIDSTQDFGVKDALIYNDERVRDTADTAFWMNLAIGSLQYLVAVLVAPLAAHFIDDTRIVLMVRVMALVLIISALGNTHDGLMLKELQYRRRYLPSLFSALIKGIVSVVLALSGAGVWSLVIGHVAGASVETIAKWLLIDWRPRLKFFTDRARMLWNYGMYILAINVLDVALYQADQLLIGTLLGEIQLGYFSVASRIPETVIANFSLVLTRILFPTFSKIKHDIPLLTESFLATTKYTGFVTIPAGFGLAAVAPELVIVFFGDRWEVAIPLMRVLAFLGMAITLPWSVGDVFKAIGRPDLSTKLQVFEAAYSFPLIGFFALHWREAAWASFGNLIAVSITAVLRLGLVTRYLPVRYPQLLALFRAPFIASGLMFAAIMGWRHVASALPAGVVLFSSVVLGGAIYAGLMLLMERKDIIEKRDFLLEMIRTRGREDVPDSASVIEAS